MFADLLVALHKPNQNEYIGQGIVAEALKAIKQYNFRDNYVMLLRNSLPRASIWQLDLSSMAGFQFVIDQNKNHLFRNESKILKDCLKGWKGFKNNLAQESRQNIKQLRNEFRSFSIWRLRAKTIFKYLPLTILQFVANV